MAVEITLPPPTFPENPENLRELASAADVLATAVPNSHWGLHAATLRHLARLTERIEELEKK